MDSINNHAERYHLKPIFGLLLVLIFFYFPVLFLGRTLQGPEMFHLNTALKSPPQIEDILKKTPIQIFNAEQMTAALLKLPQDILMGNMYRQGELPLWDTHEGLGLPFAAQTQVSAFFPLRIIQNFFPPSTRDWFYIFHLWLAGIAIYWFFIRASKIDRSSAFFGACLYIGSGAFSWFIQIEEFTSVLLVLPLLMTSIHLLAEETNGKNCAFLAGTTALMLYSGHAEAILYSFSLSFTYYLYKILSLKHNIKIMLKKVLALLIGSGLGFLIASPLLLLLLELYHNGTTYHSINIGPLSRTPYYMLPGIVFPNLLENPMLPITLPFPNYWDYVGSYIGILPLYFLLTGFFIKKIKLKNDFIFFNLFTIAFLLMNIGAWPIIWVAYLPFFKLASSTRWGATAWNFSLISAITYGFYYINNANISTREWRPILKKVFILILVLTYICFLTFIFANDQNTFVSIGFTFQNFYHPIFKILINLFFIFFSFGLFSYLILKHDNKKLCGNMLIVMTIITLWYQLPKGDFSLHFLLSSVDISVNYFLTKTLSLLLTLSFLTCIFLYIHPHKKMAFFLGTLTLIASLLCSMSFFPGYPRYEAAQKESPFIHFLKNNAGYDRIFGLDGVLSPSYSAIYGLYDIRYVSAIDIKTYHDFVNNYIEKLTLFPQCFFANSFFGRMDHTKFLMPPDFRNTMDKAIKLLSVKYIIVPKVNNDTSIKKNNNYLIEGLKVAYEDNSVTIYQNMDFLPRVFIAHKIQVAKNYNEAQKSIMTPLFDYKKEIVLEENISAINNNSTNNDAKIILYKANKVIIDAQTDKTGMLVLTDSYYPGWRAEIDGNPTKIFRVDGLMRGIILPPGKHEVTFYYFPLQFRIGIALMLLSLIICFFLFKTNIIIRNKND